MSSTDLLDLLALLLVLPKVLSYHLLAWSLDFLRALGGIVSGLFALIVLVILAGLALSLQRRLNEALDHPGAQLGGADYLRLELWSSLLALPIWPWRLLLRALRAAARWVGRRRRNDGESTPVSPTAPSSPPAEVPAPLLVATLGPGFLLTGLTTVVLYLVIRLLDPLLRAQLGLSRGLSAWQYLILGGRPELAWYLPLDRYPFLAGILALALWAVLWSVAGIAVRMVFWRQLGRNLAGAREDPAVLPIWRRWCGAPSLAAPSTSYREWAVWPLACAAPLLAWAWFSLGGDPYRVAPAQTAVTVLLWLSWILHLVLRGRERPAPPAVMATPPAGTLANGWPEVLAHLVSERQMSVPRPWEERPVEPLLFSELDPRTAGCLSPLVTDLLPAPRKLTPMQRSVLTRLALQGYVHVDPPLSLDRLTLDDDLREVLEDRSGQRVRHQVVLAREGQGKTTLAMLAAANHALVHTRGTLIVVRSEEGARGLAESFRRIVDLSPLRWNVRVRHPGGDLMNDLSQGIVPDVVVCSLRDLVLTLLDQSETFAPFLRNLGLLVVDDVESFIGPVEVHAQLAFRRLAIRLESLLRLRDYGEKSGASAPQFLILGCDSMQDTGKWARSLCGIDAVVRDFSRLAGEARARETAELAALGIAMPPDAGGAGPDDGDRSVQHFYRLRDFRIGIEERLGFEELVAACERLAVPWHFRLCGDGRRALGRAPLSLREEPAHYVDSPEDACLLLLAGTWSEVRRESRRLVRAGARFCRARTAGGGERQQGGGETIAVISQLDPDVEMALTHFDPEFSLSSALDALPRPILRPPTGLAVGPHLTADLLQQWTEVGDVVRVFGTATAPTLRRLAAAGMLLCEQRTDVDDRVNDYVEEVHVRVLARAVERVTPPEEREVDADSPILPGKVAQVEATARELVALRDRTSLAELGVIDSSRAHFVHYPGRIFQDARGTFVVVGRAADTAGDGEGAAGAHPGDVLVEPLLSDEISSPRRRFTIRSLRGESPSRLLEMAADSFPEPHRVLLGRSPFELALEPVEIRVDHLATYRLGPLYGEVRQRSLADPVTRRWSGDLALTTVALAFVPNLEIEGDAPGLTLAGGRLLAAALRALLPVLYRGAGESAQVALVARPAVDTAVRGPADLLRAGEGLYIFDAEPGGNGTARALYRDGLELPLRLCRLLLERVLSHERLRALYDEWGEEADLAAERWGETCDDAAASAELRHQVLAWLDSRLRPEGGNEEWHGTGLPAGDAEAGEGDLFDLGRCWYSRDGALSDLVWARHRWRLPRRGEAMLDVGFDRQTALIARVSDAAAEADGAEQAAAGRPTGHEVWFLPTGAVEPESSIVSLSTPEAQDLAAAASRRMTFAIDRAMPALASLGRRLRQASGIDSAADPASRYALARYLAAFVQAIPSGPEIPGRRFVSPLDCLLRRRGDREAKSLLLAALLRSNGLEAGLLVEIAGNATLAAAALPDPAPGGESAAGILHRLEAWRDALGLPQLPALWSLLPGEDGTGVCVPLAVDPRTVEPVSVEHPERWVFLPLPPVAKRTDTSGEPVTVGEAQP